MSEFCAPIDLYGNRSGRELLRTLIRSMPPQGSSRSGLLTPPLMLLTVVMTNNRKIMGAQVNGTAVNVLGRITPATIFLQPRIWCCH